MASLVDSSAEHERAFLDDPPSARVSSRRLGDSGPVKLPAIRSWSRRRRKRSGQEARSTIVIGRVDPEPHAKLRIDRPSEIHVMNMPPVFVDHDVVVPLPTDGELTEAAKAILRAGAPLNVSRMFAGTEDMFKPIADLIGAVFTASGIDVRLRELIILRCAKKLNSAYEWQANAVMAKNVGCSQEEIDAMCADGPVTGLDQRIVEMSAACDELCTDATLSDGTLARLIARYGNTGARKYILTISWFNMLSRFLNGCRVQPETQDNIGGRTSPV
ncbi:carboxymuconolactone decarboxylase family protein [Lichenibacterium ramalinae]|nr:carboxymuconolactone decarboxylase family protein [Lichenibacterium ramalinae]